MKKNILHLYILAVVLFAASAFTACSNNDEQASVLPVNTYTITINATKGDDASSAPSNRALALDDTKLNATWAAGEQVTVYNVTKSTELTGNLTALSDGASTTLSGTLTGSVAVDDVLTLKFLSPDYASQTGTLDYIAANCDYATASVTVSSIDGNNITTSSASFTNQQAIVKFTLKDNAKVNDNDLSATQLVVTANGTAAYCINGILRPRLFLDLSDIVAIKGSVTASNTLLKAVINPRTVKNPPIIKPGVIYLIAPLSTSPLVGK